MAFYRCGGGGIPSSLKTDMNAVLNKKFGTSTDYPPADWPDTVNLMGPLPEATVSGSIVTFSDGADDVPIKSCEVALPPSLDGYSSVNVVQTGKNLIPFAVDYPNFAYTQNGMTISVLNNGKVKFNGTTTALTSFSFYQVSVSTAPHIYVKNGTYTYSCYGSASVKMIVSGGSNNGFPYREIANGYYTGAVTDDTKPFNYVIFRIDSGVTLSDVEVEPMLEVGSTVTTYEPYQTPTTHTVQLGRTIHDGTVDVVKGEGTDENGNDFTFEPVEINSRLGANTMWSDGDMNVTYRRDIDLALGGQ